MNMPLTEINRPHTQAFAAQQVLPEKNNVARLDAYLNPCEMLDQNFSLQNGSHKDVKQYIVYFNHIMAFFTDGSHCGLAQPKKFVAYEGSKESPESIVLKNNSVHVEVILNAQSTVNGSTIQLEFPVQSTFIGATGEDYFVE